MRARVFNIMQYQDHPETGEHLLDEDRIKVAMAHKSIKRWAYILHDKDVYSARDEANNPAHKMGMVKPPHWHIVCQCANAVEVSVIAKWFGIPENFIDVPKGQGAFLDCVEYLTHERIEQQRSGKRLYEDEEVRASFDFRAELSARAEKRAKYGKDLSITEELRYQVLYGGKSLREIRDKYPLEYMYDVATLEKHRLRFLQMQSMPKVRLNFYIEGAGGIGKGLMSKALARALCGNEAGVKYDDEVYFEVGADRASFEGYDGQPVVIWNDCRAFTLLKKLGGRENVFNLFDPYPPTIKQNIKYSSILLTNRINIVNSVQPWSEFLDGLAGEYTMGDGTKQKAEDCSQSRRRFPLFLVLHEEDIDMGINKGVFEGTREFDQYMMYQGLRGSMRKIVSQCGDNYELRDTATKSALKPVTDKISELEDRMQRPQQGTDEEILAGFADYGTTDQPMVIIKLDS